MYSGVDLKGAISEDDPQETFVLSYLQRLRLPLPRIDRTLNTSTDSRRHLPYEYTYTKLIIALLMDSSPQYAYPDKQHKVI